MIDYNQSESEWLVAQAPAKINLMLSVHGRRGDGFHELTSLVCPLDFGDELELRQNGRGDDTLVSDGLAVPLDGSNLVLRAAQLFREQCGRSECFDFRLKKRIPVGAGLGGGSSDAVAALQGMNALLQTRLAKDDLREIASSLGSDCPLFVDAVPTVLRGRGEFLEASLPAVSDRLEAKRIILFRPPFGVNTGWAYGQLASRPQLYEAKALAQDRLQMFYGGGSFEGLLYNVFEGVVGQKFLAIPALLERLRRRGHKCLMSGSGSACFAVADDDEEAAAIKSICRSCWGKRTFLIETSFAWPKM